MINIAKIKQTALQVLKKLWHNLFLALIILLLLDLLLGAIFFWAYYLQKKAEEIPVPSSLKINTVLLESLSNDWQEREIIFQQAERKQYPDPFTRSSSQ